MRTNLLQEAINDPDPDHASKLIRDALGIQSDEVANANSHALAKGP